MGIEILRHFYFRIPVLIRLFLTILIVMLLFGILIHYIEPNQYPTIFDGVWWAFVTGATVGYGDYVPLSTLGRIIGIILMLSGAGLITFYISLFAASTVKYEKDLSKGIMPYKGSNHLICIGWNERTKSLIDMTLSIQPEKEIVLIDKSLNTLSYQHYPVHFIHGDATEDATLQKANLKHADTVIITANPDQPEEQADKYTILSTVAVRGNHEKIAIIAEIMTKRQIKNAERAGVTTIIRPNDFLSTLLYHEMFRTQGSNPFESISALLTEQQFIKKPVPSIMINKPFSTVLNYFLKEGILTIGLNRNNKWEINPKPDYQLQQNDYIIGLHKWERK